MLMPPKCYGKYWEDIDGGSCRTSGGCRYSDDCLRMFASHTLLSYQMELGPCANIQSLSNRARVSRGVINRAIARQKEDGIFPFTKEEVDDCRSESGSDVRDRRPCSKWDTSYDRARWLRERDKNPLIAMLMPGMKLRRLWDGVWTETVVCNGGYKYMGKMYPTLNAVTVAIVGTKPSPKQKKPDGTRPPGTRDLCKYSAIRFFGLRRVVGGKTGSRKTRTRKRGKGN